ncbi:hypothetical protein [Salininema proteolyticum]|uniref:Uncharacterized protein n=1 Tax=Salininema proteolyticum TaxID=1607685 RepID=A0ABV8U3V8_9ACTN
MAEGRFDKAPANLPLVGCWINSDWAAGLDLSNAPEYGKATDLDDMQGFAQIVVARQIHPHRVVWTSVLVEVYCLGVKDAIPPKECRTDKLDAALDHVYSAHTGREPIDIDLARGIVYGSAAWSSNRTRTSPRHSRTSASSPRSCPGTGSVAKRNPCTSTARATTRR